MAKDDIYVIAKAGLVVPKEGRPRTHISSETSVRVKDSYYYRKQIKQGALKKVSAPKKEKPAPAKEKPASATQGA